MERSEAAKISGSVQKAALSPVGFREFRDRLIGNTCLLCELCYTIVPELVCNASSSSGGIHMSGWPDACRAYGKFDLAASLIIDIKLSKKTKLGLYSSYQ